MSPQSRNIYGCIDLFAGIGGIRRGFEQACGESRINTVFVSEFDKYAAATYAANYDSPTDEIEDIEAPRSFDGKTVIYGDITKIPDSSLEKIPGFDICLAGFPCQAFSMAGKRLGLDDDYRGMTRGTLFREVTRVCRINKPKVVFCENVKGLMNHDKGKTFKIIRGAFEQEGYVMFHAVLNSVNFDVPQNRERVYMVAFRKEIAPAPGEFAFPKGQRTSKTIRDILQDTPIDSRYYISERYLSTLKKHREHHRKLGHGFGYRVRSLEEIAGTLSCGGMGREQNLLIDKRKHSLIPTTNIHGPINSDDIRKMTPREWARLQGFDDSFELPVADTHLYKQFGNTVTVPVVKAIAQAILVYMDNLYRPYGGISKKRKSTVLQLLTQGPMTHDEIISETPFLFLSSIDEKAKSRSMSNLLQQMKREGLVTSSGKTAAATWSLSSEGVERAATAL